MIPHDPHSLYCYSWPIFKKLLWLSFQIHCPLGNCKIFSRQAAVSCHGSSIIMDQIDVTGVRVWCTCQFVQSQRICDDTLLGILLWTSVGAKTQHPMASPPIYLSCSPSLSLLQAANASHSSYLGFPPGSYGATSALWHHCQLLLPTTNTVSQFVLLCPLTTSHHFLFIYLLKTKIVVTKNRVRGWTLFPCTSCTAFFK